MSRDIVLVDTETTSLKPDYGTGAGVIWELAVQVRLDGQRYEHLWRMKPDPALADPGALAVGKFYERTANMCMSCNEIRTHDLTDPEPLHGKPEWSPPAALAREVAVLLDGSTLVAANPTFDAGFLTAFLNEYHQAATWHYRLRDIGSMAWGFLAGQRQEGVYVGDLPPMDASTDELAAAGLGIDLSRFERHSALGDVRLLAAMLDAIEGTS